jgi:hypothetical protein
VISREENGALTSEDLKTLPSISCTIWNAIVSEGVVVFRERVESGEREQLDESQDENAKGTPKLQSFLTLSRQEKAIERISRLSNQR